MGAPFFREQGQGVGVVCLHSNASSSAQWRALADLLSEHFRVFAVDGYGAGKSPPWPSAHPNSLEHEAQLVAAVIQHAGEPVHVVGHSYGGAVALKLATLMPQRVKSVVVYEPTLFHLVTAGDPLRSPAAGVWNAATDAAACIERGDSRGAAERFIDFWMGPGSWAAMPANRQAGIAGTMHNVRGWRDVLMSEPTPVAAFAALQTPVLCLCGEDSPESSLSVVRVLQDTLPNVTVAPQRGLGHMGPVTHPALINPLIGRFLQSQ